MLIRIAGAGLRPDLKRIHIEIVFAVLCHRPKNVIVERPFHHIRIARIRFQLQHPPGKKDQADRSAGFGIYRIIGQIIIEGKRFSLVCGPDAAGNIHLLAGHIVP
ncbi:hypothetical protein D3C74_430540 [compost metagenome]